jgi:hypothetical protein
METTIRYDYTLPAGGMAIGIAFTAEIEDERSYSRGIRRRVASVEFAEVERLWVDDEDTDIDETMQAVLDNYVIDLIQRDPGFLDHVLESARAGRVEQLA